MPTLRDVIAGPWRAVLVLGVTEILSWGAIFYPPVLTVPLIADERGWSMSFAMGGFSLALLTAAVRSSPHGSLVLIHGWNVRLTASCNSSAATRSSVVLACLVS